MPEDLILISVEGDKEIARNLALLPDAFADEGVQAGNEYLLTVYRAYPPYRYVSRRAAYGKTFVSERQRRWFFANNMQDKIGNHRSQEQSRRWRIEGHGRQGFLANDAPGIQWTMGENQARQPAMVGWKKASTILQERAAQVLRKFEAALTKAKRRVGLD